MPADTATGLLTPRSLILVVKAPYAPLLGGAEIYIVLGPDNVINLVFHEIRRTIIHLAALFAFSSSI